MKKYLLLGLVISLIYAAPANALGQKKDNVDQPVARRNVQMEQYVSNSVNNLTRREKPVDLVFEQTFLSVVSKLSPEKKYIKLRKKICKVTRNEKYSIAEQNKRVTKIINTYNEKIDDNQIGYIATIARLSEKEQKELMTELNILTYNGQNYVNLVEVARDNERRLNNIAYKPDNYDELKSSINSKGNEIRGKANAALNFATKVRQLIKYAGVTVK